MAEDLAMMLRRLGETADGMRDANPKLVREKVGAGEALNVVSHADFVADQETPAPRYTSTVDVSAAVARAPLASFDEVVFRKNGVDVACVAPPTDSLFWTDSALEKFVFGYYEQLRIFPESYLAALKNDIRDNASRPFIIAVKHDSPSHSSLVAPGSCPQPAGPSPGGLYYLAPRLAQFNDGYPWVTPEQFRLIFAANRKQLLDEASQT